MQRRKRVLRAWSVDDERYERRVLRDCFRISCGGVAARQLLESLLDQPEDGALVVLDRLRDSEPVNGEAHQRIQIAIALVTEMRDVVL